MSTTSVSRSGTSDGHLRRALLLSAQQRGRASASEARGIPASIPISKFASAREGVAPPPRAPDLDATDPSGAADGWAGARGAVISSSLKKVPCKLALDVLDVFGFGFWWS